VDHLPEAAENTTRRVLRRVAGEKAASSVAESAGALSEKVVELSKDRLRDVQFLHLSDGAHFENLALYELVRRHCRYIIVSDCGTDPEVAFDDLAIALRSIREDFGVEIELDVSPLRAGADGRARQHAVVGTIHYDGYGGADKGTLLLFKPALTGDESSDVVQYQARNPAFPHESTGDQFYNEAQWESYRRLGEHAGDAVFRHLEGALDRRRDSARFVENVFLEASQRWHPSVERQNETFLALSERCAELEAAIGESAPARVRAEFFPEVAAAFGTASDDANRSVPTDPAAARDEEVRTVHFMMRVAQVMEDVWIAAELEYCWSHPLNEGWMNYFQRWASTPSFRRWWPVLRPIYNLQFRDFVRDRFGLRIKDDVARAEPTGPGATLALLPLVRPEDVREGFAWQLWEQRYNAPDLTARHALDYRLTLESNPAGLTGRSFQAGFLLYRTGRDAGGRYVEWDAEHLFVPHALIGSGVVARFLEAVIVHFQHQARSENRPDWLQVRLDPGAATGRSAVQRDRGHRLQRVHLINFYKSRGFVLTLPESDDGTQRPQWLRLPLAGRGPSAG
jgi:hypothetical protein